MTKLNIKPDLIIGYILLVPALLGEVYFFMEVYYKLGGGRNNLLSRGLTNTIWLGDYISDPGAGWASPLPIYFGLMAIAGAYLIRGNRTR